MGIAAVSIEIPKKCAAKKEESVNIADRWWFKKNTCCVLSISVVILVIGALTLILYLCGVLTGKDSTASNVNTPTVDTDNKKINSEYDAIQIQIKEIENFKCQPREKSYITANILQNVTYPSEELFPPHVIVSECYPEGGACLESILHSCTVAEQTSKVFYFIAKDKIKKTERSLNHTLPNHTKCACKKITQQAFEGNENSMI